MPLSQQFHFQKFSQIHTLHSHPDPFSAVLCPDLGQESNHSDELGPLPSGLCSWVQLMGVIGRKLLSKKRVGDVFFSLFPLPFNGVFLQIYSSCQVACSGTIFLFRPEFGNSLLLFSIPGTSASIDGSLNLPTPRQSSPFHKSPSSDLLSFRAACFQNPL